MRVEVELHREVMTWLDGLADRDWDRVVVIVDRLAEQRDNERSEIARARAAAAECARRYP